MCGELCVARCVRALCRSCCFFVVFRSFRLESRFEKVWAKYSEPCGRTYVLVRTKYTDLYFFYRNVMAYVPGPGFRNRYFFSRTWESTRIQEVSLILAEVGKIRDDGRAYPAGGADFARGSGLFSGRRCSQKWNRIWDSPPLATSDLAPPLTSTLSLLGFPAQVLSTAATLLIIPSLLLPSIQTSNMVKATSAAFAVLSALSLANAAEYTVSTCTASRSSPAAAAAVVPGIRW